MTQLPTAFEMSVTAFGDWVVARAVAASQRDNIARIGQYQRLKNQLEAAQAAETAALEVQRLAAEAAATVPKAERGKGLGAEVGMARGETPTRGQQALDVARALDQDLPHARRALLTGEIRFEHAHQVAKAVNVLDPAHRRQVDAALTDRYGMATPPELAAEARAYAQTLDPQAATVRHRKAKAARRVTCQPAADGMAVLTAYGPATDIHAMYQHLEAEVGALQRAGKTTDAAGQRRTRQQLIFDTLAGWCTTAQAGSASGSRVELVVMITPETLLGAADVPGWLAGHGSVPADVVRAWLADDAMQVFLRRIFTDPTGTQLVGLESRARAFPAGLRKMLFLRDKNCRNPYCEGRLQVGDHAEPHAKGGKTSLENGSGLCGRCNQLKENRGWAYETDPQGLTATTPTGAQYKNMAPPLIPGAELKPGASAYRRRRPARHKLTITMRC